MHFKALSIGHQNEQISSDFLLGFKGATFGEKLPIFPIKCYTISVKSIPNGFSRESLPTVWCTYMKIVDFIK